MALPITAMILTLNEELNLPLCLESLRGLCDRIFVVDSGSTDRTVAIAKEAGAEVVQHPFETHAKQWNWAIKNLPIQTEWILALDADQRATPELRSELLEVLPRTPPEIHGYHVPRKQIFRGRWIRHGGYWPKYLLKIFRRGAAQTDEQELLDFRFYVQKRTGLLKQPLIEHNLKEDHIQFWLQKHLRFIDLLAQEEFFRRSHHVGWRIQPRLWGMPDQRTLWCKQVWYRTPLVLRSFLYFAYRYGIRLGFLDGPEGALFHFLQGFWLRLMVDVRIGELERDRRSGTS